MYLAAFINPLFSALITNYPHFVSQKMDFNWVFHKLASNAFVRQMRRPACWELLPIPSNIRFSSADLRPAPRC